MRPTILIVDDDASIRKLLSVGLGYKGYTLLIAAHGGMALELAEGHAGPLDLLIVDICLPELDGIELSKRISESHPEVKTLYISGYSEAEVAHRLGLPGRVVLGGHFLAKPFLISELSVRIEEILSAPVLGADSSVP